MKLALLREADPAETRVAASPDSVKRFVGLGFDVAVQTGAGEKSRILDADYAAAGARIVAADALLADADVVLAVRRPEPGRLKGLKPGALVLAIMDPYGAEAALEKLAGTGAASFAMELMPRITRAQTMDVLSSQANLAGYRAVIEAAEIYDRALPMMMTAAGTVPAARVFVMGAGVAGLQAIATARRLGAVVSATDVRPAAKEQVESLGAKFIAVEDEEFRQAETAAGYAKEMSEEYRRKQAELVASHIAKQDIVVTTALIPGRPAPRLISSAMIASMRPGSVVVDLAVERGGNVEGSQPGAVTDHNGVRIAGHLNMPGRLGATASQLYARNLYAFVETFVDKSSKTLKVNWDDELVKATLLTRDGAIVHPNFGAKPAVEPASVGAAEAPAAEQAKSAEPTAETNDDAEAATVRAAEAEAQSPEPSAAELTKTTAESAPIPAAKPVEAKPVAESVAPAAAASVPTPAAKPVEDAKPAAKNPPPAAPTPTVPPAAESPSPAVAEPAPTPAVKPVEEAKPAATPTAEPAAKDDGRPEWAEEPKSAAESAAIFAAADESDAENVISGGPEPADANAKNSTADTSELPSGTPAGAPADGDGRPVAQAAASAPSPAPKAETRGN